MILRGKKIYLRKLDVADATSGYLSWFNDLAIASYIKNKPTSTSDLESFILQSNSEAGCYLFGIFTYDDIHIGNIKLDPIDYMPVTVGLGIMIGEAKFRGGGRAFEAMKLAFLHIGEISDIETVILGVNNQNLKAIKLYKDFGFQDFHNPYDPNQDSLTMKITISEISN